MTFEQIIALASVSVSALAILSPCVSATVENKKRSKQTERDICVKFLRYCKIAFNNKMTDEDLKDFIDQYILLKLIRNKQLQENLQTCFNEIIEHKPTAKETFGSCLELFSNCKDYSL
ncbi:MAG: hypothetical protein IJE01_01710 [Clostridia bacterium]|nr:hypothetical protein [Clostridia bacterium]